MQSVKDTEISPMYSLCGNLCRFSRMVMLFKAQAKACGYIKFIHACQSVPK